MANALLQRFSRGFTGLNIKLKQAGINDTPELFLKKTLISALYVSGALVLFLWLLLSKSIGHGILLAFPIIFAILFAYFFKIPDVKLLKKEREINSEIVFAGRFLIIELESGVPMYDAFKNIAKNYPAIGKYFSDIVTKMDFGTEMEDALNEAINLTPSANFRKVLWQIINSQHTGADVTTALKSVVNVITKEQMIAIQEYGRKLNPLAMFYMIIAVILPSIGITMFIVLSTFLNLKLSLPILIFISFFLGFMQFMFLAMIRSSRPSVDL